MSYGLRILPDADADVDNLALNIAQNSVEQAKKFYDAVAATYRAILEHPRRGPIYGYSNSQLSELRKLSITGFSNHLVFYRNDADMVEIVRVLHGARDLPSLFEDTTSTPE